MKICRIQLYSINSYTPLPLFYLLFVFVVCFCHYRQLFCNLYAQSVMHFLPKHKSLHDFIFFILQWKIGDILALLENFLKSFSANISSSKSALSSYSSCPYVTTNHKHTSKNSNSLLINKTFIIGFLLLVSINVCMLNSGRNYCVMNVNKHKLRFSYRNVYFVIKNL